MTLNDLEYPIHLKVRLVDVSLLRGFGFDHMHRCSQRGRIESGLEGLAPLHVGSFSAVAELLVLFVSG